MEIKKPTQTADFSSLGNEQKNYTAPFAIMTGLFFIWGFMTVVNDVLIPHLKEIFDLSYFEVMLVQTAFFGAYFTGALIYFIISVISGDPINRIGYKNGVILGLVVSVIGSVLFFPATIIQEYWFYLMALFIVGLGFAVLQIAANPYVAILGHEKTASSRLNLAQGFNSFGTTIAPLIGGFLIFKYFAGDDAVKYPYLIFGSVLLLLIILFLIVKLPKFSNKDEIEKGVGALKFPNLSLGAIAIFLYVGGEVSIGSILISFLGLENIAGLEPNDASAYLGMYWGGLMIGRFLGALSLSNIKTQVKSFLMIGISIVAFLIVYLAVYIKSDLPFDKIAPFIIILVLNYFFFLLGKSLPHRTLSIFAGVAILMLLLGIFTNGQVAMWSIIGIGLFNSIMWSNIFTLAIAGLGKHTSQGSSLLVMAILGGAIIPPIQGAVADVIGVHASFIVPIVSYLYIGFYGLKGYRQKQHIIS